jgi:hypothetical protein
MRVAVTKQFDPKELYWFALNGVGVQIGADRKCNGFWVLTIVKNFRTIKMRLESEVFAAAAKVIEECFTAGEQE